MTRKFNHYRSDKERGAVLLTTLLVMSLMATLAVEVLDDVRFGVRRTANVQDAAQADAYTQAAQDFAGAYLDAQLKSTTPEQISQYLKSAPQTLLPFEGGGMTLTLRDGGSCISLGAVTDAAGRRQFRRLLMALGKDAQSAAALTSVLADWIDADSQALPDGGEDYAYLDGPAPYRTANTAMTSPMELRALKGVDEELYQMLRPYICARPASAATAINVNALTPAQAPVLAAILGDDALQAAQTVLQNTGAAFTAESFRAAPAISGLDFKDVDVSALAYETKYIGIEAQIVYQSIRRVTVMEFEIVNGQAKLRARRFGDEARRPLVSISDPQNSPAAAP